MIGTILSYILVSILSIISIIIFGYAFSKNVENSDRAFALVLGLIFFGLAATTAKLFAI